MKALVTGASSGIGRDMAFYLSELGFDLILVAKDKQKLEEVQKNIKTKSQIIIVDLAIEEKIKDLFVLIKNEDIDVVINNAGFGLFGNFYDTELSKEIDMINVNIKAVHILTKLFIKEMRKKDKGYILNVASAAAFESGPLMATYYATKSYVYRLTEAVSEELRKDKSHVYVSCLCPGPVDTNFNNVAHVHFSSKPQTSKEVAKYAIDKMFDNQLLIIPSFKMRMVKFGTRFFSDRFIMKIAYKFQHKKSDK
jgi:short-subunit dehydrogenase